MVEIPVEKKGGHGWLWALLALILLALLLWWILADDEEEVVVPTGEPAAVQPLEPAEPIDGQAVAPGAAGAAGAEMTIPAILANPSAYFGRDGFTGEVDVPEVATDRAFWIQNQGERMLAVILDQPQEQPKDINPGQRLRITGGTVRDAGAVEDLRGDTLEPDTQRLLEQQQVFLLVPEGNIEILQEGTPQ